MNNSMNLEKIHKTYFDTPERDTNDNILKEITLFESNLIVKQMLEGFPEIAVIINKERQIVAFNSKALSAFNVRGYIEIIGKRFGEAIQCVHYKDSIFGCGTTRACAECGAASAIRTTRISAAAREEECRITINADGSERSLELFIHTQPLNIYDKVYTIFAIRDISAEKRRDTLERIFFHDVLNTAGALDGIAELMTDAKTNNEKEELISALSEASKQLLNEILSQRELRMAEDGILNPNFGTTSVSKILSTVFDLYKNHELSIGKYLERERSPEDLEFITDSTLLIRSLGNILKNALEASGVDDVVKIHTSHTSDNVFFSISNNKVIPNDIQLHLFQRSFSTKQSKGRGIGLYSVKLIVEQYLRGKVSFVSNKAENTIFTIQLPLNPSID